MELLLAPFLYNDIATGMTPHEHNGMGIPINVAFMILIIPRPDKLSLMNLSLIKKCSEYNLPLIISTGMWSEDDIEKCVKFYKENNI